MAYSSMEKGVIKPVIENKVTKFKGDDSWCRKIAMGFGALVVRWYK